MKCLICNREFKSVNSLAKHLRNNIHGITIQEYYDKFLKKEGEGVCRMHGVIPFCKGMTHFHNFTKGYAIFCSTKCMRACPEVNQKIENTTLRRFGVKNASQSEDIKKKKEDTCLEHYGVKYGAQSKIVQSKIENTCLEKYGVNHPSQHPEIKNKQKQKHFEKYGNYAFLQEYVKAKNPFLDIKFQKEKIQSIEGRAKIKRTRIYNYWKKMEVVLKYLNLEHLGTFQNEANRFSRFKCKICGYEFDTKSVYLTQGYGRCPKCYPRSTSVGETSLKKFIENLGFTIEANTRQIIAPYELDIFIPSANIAIEYNGLMWHSEEHGKDKNYHLRKLTLCQEKNIRLIQIFEDEWIFKRNIVEERLCQILHKSCKIKVGARKCNIEEIGTEANDFLNKNHLQGKDNSVVRIGAFYNFQLLAVMTFSHGSPAKGGLGVSQYTWELNRYCCNKNYHIPGIASKLLSYFKRNYKWDMIYSYADRRWSDGDLYYKLNFNLDHITPPNYWYARAMKRVHRFNFRKKPEEPKDVPEWVLRAQQGYFRIWDCGHLKFIIKNKEVKEGE
jgi:predicted Zn-ribbon and HTH transcriptional regulator